MAEITLFVILLGIIGFSYFIRYLKYGNVFDEGEEFHREAVDFRKEEHEE